MKWADVVFLGLWSVCAAGLSFAAGALPEPVILGFGIVLGLLLFARDIDRRERALANRKAALDAQAETLRRMAEDLHRRHAALQEFAALWSYGAHAEAVAVLNEADGIKVNVGGTAS